MLACIFRDVSTVRHRSVSGKCRRRVAANADDSTQQVTRRSQERRCVVAAYASSPSRAHRSHHIYIPAHLRARGDSVDSLLVHTVLYLLSSSCPACTLHARGSDLIPAPASSGPTMHASLFGLAAAALTAVRACDSCPGPSADVVHERLVRRIQPESSEATVDPRAPLEWGQLNFLHTVSARGRCRRRRVTGEGDSRGAD